jgi:ATP-dependent DNA helicase RecG
MEDTRYQRVIVVLSVGKDATFTTEEQMIDLMSKDPKISAAKMSKEIGVSVPTIKNHLKILTDNGTIKRIGGTRGYWELT